MANVLTIRKLPVDLQVQAPDFKAKSCIAKFVGKDFDLSIPCTLVNQRRKNGREMCTVRLGEEVTKCERVDKPRYYGLVTFTFTATDDRTEETIPFEPQVDFLLDGLAPVVEF